MPNKMICFRGYVTPVSSNEKFKLHPYLKKHIANFHCTRQGVKKYEGNIKNNFSFVKKDRTNTISFVLPLQHIHSYIFISTIQSVPKINLRNVDTRWS